MGEVLGVLAVLGILGVLWAIRDLDTDEAKDARTIEDFQRARHALRRGQRW